MYNPIARLVTRTANDEGTKCDLIIGTCLKGQSVLKPNTVYEARECVMTGDIILVRVGESVVGNNVIYKGGWSYEIKTIMARFGRYLFWTKKEYINHCEQQEEIRNLEEQLKD